MDVGVQANLTAFSVLREVSIIPSGFLNTLGHFTWGYGPHATAGQHD
jgi:hypothetical protein